MRDISSYGAIVALLATLMLGGCSSVSDIPYPKLSDIVPVDEPRLSAEERAAMIDDLQRDQQTHKAAATTDIETR